MRPPRDDAGVSLVELLVAMSLMAMVGAMFTTGIVQIRRSINKADSTYESQNQINSAFLRLDREVRYATGVSTPAQVSGDSYVEYSVTVNGVDTCVELRLKTATRELQRRQWVHGATPLQPTGWTTLASGVTATTPFATTIADKATLTGLRFQTLTLNVTSTTGAGAQGSARETNVSFTALNTSVADSSKVCIEGRSVSS
ncbi:prepilin-type N-terminal cleavage/methylation domain-containing protein [Actinoplanes sp. KI2]|uniref:PulJ/GspJ family protein n=1 Tax=Actinoplanes sp. KI2 TaxID=2983315 RepID=UPI0021D5C651|nr:prepilin-type N-terminal cleavage/methylation domain-containing protein [Actinoplanes sp. KI2]MCU7729269.1 prepilin-type N-terminal cleavage/methylation domain-containing protein [Actinoplanes sp. KI2]